MSKDWDDLTSIPGYAEILRRRGVDLCDDSSFPPAPGTPVYVDGSADAPDVLRRMHEADVRVVFVLRGGLIIGVVEAPGD